MNYTKISGFETDYEFITKREKERRVFMDYIITTEQLTKKYKNFISVNKVSMHIQKGSIYGFLGPNGAGKIYHNEDVVGADIAYGWKFHG